MSFLFLTGLIFLIMPILIILGLSVAMFIFFLRDDRDAKAVLNILLGSMIFGIILLAIYFVTNAI
jgi:hypothetical protein